VRSKQALLALVKAILGVEAIDGAIPGLPDLAPVLQACIGALLAQGARESQLRLVPQGRWGFRAKLKDMITRLWTTAIGKHALRSLLEGPGKVKGGKDMVPGSEQEQGAEPEPGCKEAQDRQEEATRVEPGYAEENEELFTALVLKYKFWDAQEGPGEEYPEGEGSAEEGRWDSEEEHEAGEDEEGLGRCAMLSMLSPGGSTGVGHGDALLPPSPSSPPPIP